MNAKSAAGLRRTVSPRMMVGATAALLGVVLVIVLNAVLPYAFGRNTIQNEIATQIRATTGLSVAMRHARFDLLPRPHVTTSAVLVSDPSGAFTIEAGAVDSEVRLLPLLVGRIELSSATLTRPHVSVGLDAETIARDSTLGRAGTGGAAARTAPDQRLGSVTLVDGTVDVRSRVRRTAVSFTDVNVTVDWRDLDSAASLTGEVRWKDTTADVSVWVAQPIGLIRHDRSAMVFHVHAAPLDISAQGDLSVADHVRFKGHWSAAAPSLAAVLALAPWHVTLPAPFQDATLDSDGTLAFDDRGFASADLQNLQFRADGNRYEGTLGFIGGASPLVSGTLATGTLKLAPFMSYAPCTLDKGRAWSPAPFAPLQFGSVALDLRISAAHLQCAPFAIDDAALSVMTRGDRLEIGLIGEKAYGGALKARVSLGAGSSALNLRAAGTLTGADLALLSWDAFGRQLASGTLSGSANLETRGASVLALAQNLEGWLEGRAKNGEVSGIDLGRALREAGAMVPHGGSTPFVSAQFGAHLAAGIAGLENATLKGPAADAELAGSADMGARALDLHAVIRPGAVGTTKTLRVDLTGGFDKIVVQPDAGRPAAPTTPPRSPP